MISPLWQYWCHSDRIEIAISTYWKSPLLSGAPRRIQGKQLVTVILGPRLVLLPASSGGQRLAKAGMELLATVELSYMAPVEC